MKVLPIQALRWLKQPKTRAITQNVQISLNYFLIFMIKINFQKIITILTSIETSI